MIDFSKVLDDPENGMKSEVLKSIIEDGRNVDNIVPIALNLDVAKSIMAQFDRNAADMQRQAMALEVKTDVQASVATEMAGQVKRLSKAVDDRRKNIIAEPDSFVRKVNGFCKPIQDTLKGIEVLIKKKLGDHAYSKELERREIEKRQREEAAKLQEQINKQAEAKGVEPVTVAPVAIPTKAGPVRSESATASTVMVWDFEIVNASDIPREYCLPSEMLIRQAIVAGMRDIPGIRIYERADIRVRRVG